ncbi:unnamed protein product [Durusdinium trenchii]|uniref:Uncharacterized protein n=2 Tax=Durusdinium trenchii TaxID=1381693 RepID=A0ABP0NRK7_9DINO
MLMRTLSQWLPILTCAVRPAMRIQGHHDLDDAKHFDIGDLQGFEDLERLHKAVSRALGETFAIVSFSTAAWTIPLDMSEDAPYLNAFQKLNSTHGLYKATKNEIYFSGNSGDSMFGIPTLEGDGTDELDALGFGTSSKRASESEVQDNLAAKHVVVQVNYAGGCGYFGHAIDNVFPRVLAILPGAKRANHTVSVVIPEEAREFFSPNTETLFQALGIDVLADAPRTPHRMMGVTRVASWDRLVRQNARAVIRSELLGSVRPATCADGKAVGQGGDLWEMVFFSRHSGTRNVRHVEGAEAFEDKLRQKGYYILDNPGAMSVEDLAKQLYTRTCRLAGFSGTALLNLIFLPDHAKLVELNPTGLYADYWEWAHALGMSYAHRAPSSSINAFQADALVDFVDA